MKVIIDIDEDMYKACQRAVNNPKMTVDEVDVAIANGTPVLTEGDLISREALKKAIQDNGYKHYFEIFEIIDNAPTVEIRDNFDIGYVQGLEDGQKRPQGEWIPVGVILPEAGKSVLVCVKTQGGISQFVSERFNGNNWSALCGREPIAWQPLPKPYEGEEQ